MLIVISPSKKQNFESKPLTKKFTIPVLIGDSMILADKIRELTINDLTKLMNISYGLAEKNIDNFKNWQPPFTLENAKQAIHAFQGDVYSGIQAETLTEEELERAQRTVRILSGLYGILKPLDLIQPYRLEMGIKLKNPRGNNVYDFWGDLITYELDNFLQEHKNRILLNLTSGEYFKSIVPDKINGKIITPVFKENKNGNYRVISFYAKKARGLMTRFIIKNDIKEIEQLKEFKEEGYSFSESMSENDRLVFIR